MIHRKDRFDIMRQTNQKLNFDNNEFDTEESSQLKLYQLPNVGFLEQLSKYEFIVYVFDEELTSNTFYDFQSFIYQLEIKYKYIKDEYRPPILLIHHSYGGNLM